MKKFNLPLIALLFCAVSFFRVESFAQTPPPVPSPSAKETPKPISSPSPTPPPAGLEFMQRPDYKAYMAAISEKDSGKKITAIEKYTADFPDSAFISSANEILLATVVKFDPTNKNRILTLANKLMDGIKPEMAIMLGVGYISRPFTAVIDSLYNAGLTEEAQTAAQKAIKMYDEVSAKQLFSAKYPIWLAQGRDYLKKGDLKRAEISYRQVLSGEYEGNAPLVALAEISEKRKKTKQQLDYLIQADAKGTLKRDQRAKLEEIFLKRNGSREKLVELLDENYRKANPNPIKAVKYTPDDKRTKRTVLAELFTGSACAPCVNVDLSFDSLWDRYSPADVAILVYHLHIPAPDPMTNPASVARGKYYKTNSTPTYFIDGGEKNTGGNSNRKQAQFFFDRITPKIDAQLKISEGADLTLTASRAGDIIKTSVNYGIKKPETTDLKLHIALVEHEMSYMGENGIRFHHLVVRELGGEKREGFLLKDKNGTAEWSFDLKKVTEDLRAYLEKFETEQKADDANFAFADKARLVLSKHPAIVAFIQDDKTKSVLQSAFFDLSANK